MALQRLVILILYQVRHTEQYLQILNSKLYGTTFGPSNVKLPLTYRYDAVINGTLIANVDPEFDDCSDNTTILMKGKNIGDLLNVKGITWGWFAGGFRLPNKSTDVKINCNNRLNNTSASGIQTKDYYPDIEPFQYYNSTANPHHIPPSSVIDWSYRPGQSSI